MWPPPGWRHGSYGADAPAEGHGATTAPHPDRTAVSSPRPAGADTWCVRAPTVHTGDGRADDMQARPVPLADATRGRGVDQPVPTGACRTCHAADPDVVLDLGRRPQADSFPETPVTPPDAEWPLVIGRCPACGLFQLLGDSPPEEDLVGAATWTTSATMAAHVEALLEARHGRPAAPGRACRRPRQPRRPHRAHAPAARHRAQRVRGGGLAGGGLRGRRPPRDRGGPRGRGGRRPRPARPTSGRRLPPRPPVRHRRGRRGLRAAAGTRRRRGHRVRPRRVDDRRGAVRRRAARPLRVPHAVGARPGPRATRPRRDPGDAPAGLRRRAANHGASGGGRRRRHRRGRLGRGRAALRARRGARGPGLPRGAGPRRRPVRRLAPATRAGRGRRADRRGPVPRPAP
jgi:hypothetical protein